ncbi:MAG: SDR family oxidoreductase [Cyanobacteria bacterium SBLK]|nr:SDR family oxidoreductase [Cyanobacteria bacterium SBLK]
MNRDFINQKILVTGSSSGIGAAIAKSFAKYNTKLILHYNRNYEGVIDTRKEVIQRGSQAKILQCDFRNEEEAPQFFSDAVTFFCGIDILINNAGVIPKKEINDTDLKLWKDTFSINLNFPFLLSKLFVSDRLEKGKVGAILNISSIHGDISCEKFSAYSASKAALNALMQVQAVEWSKHNIRVNTISPGVIEVERNKHKLREQKKLWMPKIPLGRYGTTHEIGELAVFLCSGSASWITGQTFTIDGGTTARGNYPIRE